MQNIVEEIRAALTPNPTPELNELENPNGHGSIVAVKEGYKLERLPGQTKNSRRHVFHDPRSFAEWLNRHANPECAEVLVGITKVNACLTPLDPCGDSIVCELREHPEFATWRGVFGGQMLSQKEFHAFIRGHLAGFPNIPGDAQVNSGKVLAGEVQKLSVNAGKDFQGELDPTGYYRFQGGSGKVAVEGKIPPSFEIAIPVFIGVAKPGDATEIRYRMEVLVSIDIGSDSAPFFTLSCPSLPLVLHQARIDAADFLRSLLKGDFLVGLGNLAVAEVPVITD